MRSTRISWNLSNTCLQLAVNIVKLTDVRHLAGTGSHVASLLGRTFWVALGTRKDRHGIIGNVTDGATWVHNAWVVRSEATLPSKSGSSWQYLLQCGVGHRWADHNFTVRGDIIATLYAAKDLKPKIVPTNSLTRELALEFCSVGTYPKVVELTPKWQTLPQTRSPG
eukprot:4986278-Amphidinium_carterae.2